MSLFNILSIIVCIWLIFKLKSFMSSIKISSDKSADPQKNKSRKTGMDIQDADYEDVE